MREKKCPFMGPGKRCRGGYHLRGTTSTTPINENVAQEPREQATPTIPEAGSNQVEGNLIIDPNSLKDFLGKMIREEMASAMSQNLPFQATPQQPPQHQSQTVLQPQPQPHREPQPQPQRFQTSQDYLMALLGQNLLSRQ